MVSCNSIYSLLRDGAFFAHINGDHDHVSRYKSYIYIYIYIYIFIYIFIYSTIFITLMTSYFSKNHFGGLIFGGRGTISGRAYNRGTHVYK